MTTTASKHGLKAAAKEKSKKHAQRTPLPPKQGRVAETQSIIEEALASISAKQGTAESVTKSAAKANAFVVEIGVHGWGCTQRINDGDRIEVTARRGDETLFIEWMNGVYQNSATYTIADRTIKLRNASAAKSYAARDPKAGAEELQRVTSNKAFRKKEVPDAELQRSRLPFDPTTASEPEILAALLGRGVTWHNRISVKSESAMVGKDPRRAHFTEFEGERIFNFCCPNTGFRSFRLSALLRVGRVKSVTTRGQANTGVPVEVEVVEDAPAKPVVIRRKKVGA